ncbi:MAG: DUF5060 domain-containing protein [Saprospiraceae bacterium]
MNRSKTFFLLLFFLSLYAFYGCNNTTKADAIQQIPLWHTLTLSFSGTTTSESSQDNPFLNYRLLVDFCQNGNCQTIRGFYAADGNAAETSADSGSVWQVRFTPDRVGEWTYRAQLRKGNQLALNEDLEAGNLIEITNAAGSFSVTATDKQGDDFRAKGRLVAAEGYFKFADSDQYFLKVGTNSPENFLAFAEFDGTYRMSDKTREGEAKVTKDIHHFEPHIADWLTGDPTWQNGKGKGIIGAANYLASKGMNAIYFLTFNIGGDGKDVWMYRDPTDFTRFDVSKLEQWEIVFQHLQSKGILLHLVTQETENELTLDGGDTGDLRKLYYSELIARFGHHLGLVWNLGEENGAAPWAPNGQIDRQRKAMAKFIKTHDPYHHPVIIHTQPYDPLRSDILDSLLGYQYLDGISLQQDKREHASEVVQNWREKSAAANQKWLVTMDEIGKWHTGALTDTADVNHPTLMRYALWGTLLSGGAGVEWYFGGRHVHNDLTSEDWRQRDQLWEITNHAKTFFEDYLPYWKMQPATELVQADSAYCMQLPNEIYAIYAPDFESIKLNLSATSDTLHVQWFDPLNGGELKTGIVEKVVGGDWRNLGMPPATEEKGKKDWVILVRKNIE